jgi:hypothetical protein
MLFNTTSASHYGSIKNNQVEKAVAVASVGCTATEKSKSPCWVGTKMAWGWIRGCSNLPAVCRQLEIQTETTNINAAAGTSAQNSRWDEKAGTLTFNSSSTDSSSVAVRVFGSKEECCAAESGAFAAGCSSIASGVLNNLF